MRYLLLLSFSLILGSSVSAQYAKKEIKTMKRLMEEWGPEDVRDTIPARFPGMTQYRLMSPVNLITDHALLEALSFNSYETIGPLRSGQDTCSLVRVLEVGSTEWAQASYIFLDKRSGTPEVVRARADSIRTAINSGLPFAEAHKKFTMDGNKNGGDLGWFRVEQMPWEFSDAVFTHHKGDLIAFPVEIYGWYIVSITGEPATYKHARFLVARGPICL